MRLPPKDRAHEQAQLESCVAAFEAELDYIYRALRRHGISESDADDLAQEVFLIMWRRWADYDAQRPLRPWLAGIAFRVAYNHRDRMAREVPGGLVDTRDQTDGPEDRIASHRLRALVLSALSQVPEKQRTAMILHHLDGLGVRDVARTTKVPLFTAYSRLRAGRRAFASAIRRLNTIAGALALPSRPEALLAAAEPAPSNRSASGRARAASRVRSLLLLPAAGRSPAGGGRSRVVAGESHVLRWMAVTGLAGSCAVLAFLMRDRIADLPGASAGTLPALMVGPSGRAGGVQKVAATSLPSLKVVPPPTPDPFPPRLAEGIAAYWRFDEGQGLPAVVDLSGHTNDCLPQRMGGRRGDWVAGPHGSAITFGGRAWLECPAVDPLARGAAEMTIAAWIKRTGPPEKVRAIVSRQHGRGRGDSFFLGFREDKLLFASDVWQVQLAADFPVAGAQARWIHVAATRDRDRLARIYVDGLEVAQQKTPVAPPVAFAASGENALLIGAAMNGPAPASPSERFVGSLDELLIYDRALPPEEVAALAAGSQPALSR
jgi:RNA polymerase sigma factor (sigma-70 family)